MQIYESYIVEYYVVSYSKGYQRGVWLAQLVKHVTLDLGVVSLSPMLGVKIIPKKKKTLKTKLLEKNIRILELEYQNQNIREE